MNFHLVDEKLHQEGLTSFNEYADNIGNSLSSFINSNGTVDGTRLQKEWFTPINADFFISHSHNDEDLAITLAGWIKSRLGLKTFVDSCIWKHSNVLQKELDDIYSYVGNNNYNYAKSNRAASHVHNMLSTALTMMIDRAECFIFLNTPNSVDFDKNIELTQSPWIYSEIMTSKFIESRIRRKRMILEKADKIYSQKIGSPPPLKVQYKLDLEHLTEVNWHEIRRPWADGGREIPTRHGLDVLYDLTGVG